MEGNQIKMARLRFCARPRRTGDDMRRREGECNIDGGKEALINLPARAELSLRQTC